MHRDAAYITVLTSVLSDAMTGPELCLETLYENSLALVALEEVIGPYVHHIPSQYSTVHYYIRLYSAIQYNTIQYSTVHVSIIQQSAVLSRKEQHKLV